MNILVISAILLLRLLQNPHFSVMNILNALNYTETNTDFFAFIKNTVDTKRSLMQPVQFDISVFS